MSWVYTLSEPGLWTVGYHRPDGTWFPESDHDSKEAAAARVHWLNGGHVAELEKRVADVQLLCKQFLARAHHAEERADSAERALAARERR
jgi:hypothetical protein